MAGEDIDLKLIIKALLDSKGFTEAQVEMKRLAGTASGATPSLSGLTDKTKGLTKELGGSRGAVADMTRVLLMNIGVTGAAGNVAKAAGAGVSVLTGSMGALGFGAAGVVAIAALLIPKLMELGLSSKEAAEEARRLTDAAIEQLPELEALAEKIGKVNKALELQVEAVRKQALDKQAETIAQYTRQIVALQQEASDLAIKIERVGFGLERAAPGSATAKRVEEYKEQLRKLNLEIDRQSAVLQELLDAQDKSTTSGAIRTKQTESAAEAERQAEKALRERNKALAEQLELDRAIFRENARRIQQENKDRAEANKQRQKDIQTATERILQIEAEGEARRREIEEAKAAKRQEVAEGIALSAQAAAALVGLFTKNKAINIVAAIADTYAAGVGTLKATAGMGPWVSVPAMAMVIAAGLANVQRIREQNVGFDDPFADLVARKMGRKSAEDFARHFGSEFAGRLPGAMAQATNVYNQHTTINRGTSVGAVNYNSIVGARKTQQLKQLNRDLITIDRLEDRTRLGR